MTDKGNNEKTEEKLVDPVLGRSSSTGTVDYDETSDLTVEEEEEIEEAQAQGQTGSGPESLSLDLNEGKERKKKIKVSPEVEKLDKEMDKAGLITGDEEKRVIEALAETERQNYEDYVVSKTIRKEEGI